MADNWLENKFEAMRNAKSKEEKAREIAWKKRMKAYKEKLDNEKNNICNADAAGCVPDGESAE